MILLAILGRFVIVVDSMYRNSVRKIVVSSQIVRDFSAVSLRKTQTLEFEQTLKKFSAVPRNLARKTTWCKFMSKLSVIVKTKTHIAFFCTGCKILITLFTSAVVEYYYFGRQMMCKIKIEPFVKQ